MKRINKIITVALALASATLLFGAVTMPVDIKASENTTYYIANEAEQEPSITNRGDVIEWQYEIFNGKLYKRLYNWSTDEWIGDWILC